MKLIQISPKRGGFRLLLLGGLGVQYIITAVKEGIIIASHAFTGTGDVCTIDLPCGYESSIFNLNASFYYEDSNEITQQQTINLGQHTSLDILDGVDPLIMRANISNQCLENLITAIIDAEEQRLIDVVASIDAGVLAMKSQLDSQIIISQG